MTTGSVCVVTGAASGIGLATTRALLADGWRIAMIDVDAAALEAAHAGLDVAEGQTRMNAIDITDAAAVDSSVLEIANTFGPVAGVVNSAGIARDVPFLETEPDMFRRILDVNVVGSFLVARAGARAMIAARNAGAIVNVASISGLRGNIGRTAYGASKGAVVIMSKVMAVELAARNIRVNAVAPGPVDTPMVRALHNEGMREVFLRSIPQKRYAQPEEIAAAIVFLLDNKKAGNITGQILAVDGGFDGGGLLPS